MALKVMDTSALTTPLAKARPADPIIAGSVPAPVVATATPVPRQPQIASDTTKLTVRIDPELLGRARAAFMASASRLGTPSLSAWCSRAIEKAVLDVEAELNGGNPFTPLGVDAVPKGRLSGV